MNIQPGDLISLDDWGYEVILKKGVVGVQMKYFGFVSIEKFLNEFSKVKGMKIIKKAVV